MRLWYRPVNRSTHVVTTWRDGVIYRFIRCDNNVCILYNRSVAGFRIEMTACDVMADSPVAAAHARAPVQCHCPCADDVMTTCVRYCAAAMITLNDPLIFTPTTDISGRMTEIVLEVVSGIEKWECSVVKFKYNFSRPNKLGLL